MNEITIIAPDDWHCHLRDEIYLPRTVPDVARTFKRAIIMPNLSPPVTTVAQARDYFNRIQQHIPADRSFTPLMTLYLTDNTTPTIIQEAAASETVKACKLYPAGATFQSSKGVTHIKNIQKTLEAMQSLGLPLLIHGEVVDPTVDIFDREAVFIEQILQPLIKNFPELKIVMEHISTKTAAEFVAEGPKNLAATITPHHLLLNRNNLLVGGIHPHHYCLPVIKTALDQAALIQAAISGNPKFFLGTDSAPHLRSAKESCCGPAGIYSAHAALELYAEVFEQQGALNRLEAFASEFGPAFYKLSVNTDRITLVKKPWTVPNKLPYGGDFLVPLKAGETLNWQLQVP